MYENHALSRRRWLTVAGVSLAALASRPLVRAQTVGEIALPESLVNLGGNENPLGPSTAVMRAILRAAPQSSRYPFREEERLREALAEREGVSVDHIVLGNGCDDVLAMAAQACIQKQDTVVCASPTYFQLPDFSRKLGASLVEVPHRRTDRRHDLEAMARAAEMGNAKLVYVCNPDNPTGTECDPDELGAFCRRLESRCPIVVDEVYLELGEGFAEKTQVRLVREGLPVIVTRSFSKVYGLAGHRIGYAVARPDLAKALAGWQRSGLNFIGVAAARSALTDTQWIAYARSTIGAERARFAAVLAELGLEYQPSLGNFIFHETRRPMADFQAAMKTRGFIVGWPHPAAHAYPTWCRTSIGTEAEMRGFYAALRAEFGKVPG